MVITGSNFIVHICFKFKADWTVKFDLKQSSVTCRPHIDTSKRDIVHFLFSRVRGVLGKDKIK